MEERSTASDVAASVMDAMADPVIAVGADTALLWGNRAAEERYGAPLDTLIGRSLADWIHPDDQHAALLAMASVIDKPKGSLMDVRIRDVTGEYSWFELRGRRWDDGPERSVALTLHEVTDRRGLEISRGDADLLAAILDHLPVVGFLLDADGLVRGANGALPRLLHHDLEATIGRPFTDLVAPHEAWRVAQVLHEAAQQPGTAHLEARLRRANGVDLPMTLSVVNLLDDRVVRGLLVTAVDITPLAEARHELERRATTDVLTGLANRATLRSHLDTVLSDEPTHTVLFADVDDLKVVNDRYGHAAGDAVLRTIADRLRAVTRPGDLVARLGGDEFAVLTIGPAGEHEVGPVLARIQEALRTSVTISGVRLDMGASLGVAFAPGDAVDADALFQKADVALYAAKRNRGSTAFYADDEDQHSVERLSLLGELREALEVGEIFPVYQPKTSLVTGRTVGVEALARWNHATLGLLGPARFIPLAESTGLIEPITLHLLDKGLEQLATWNANGLELTLAVNLSARLLAQPRLPEYIQERLSLHGVEPCQLTLEVTESMLMADTDRAIAVLETLNKLGVRISIDDFGTGYSSLAYLKRFPVDELKIDKGFVRGIAHDRHDAAIAAMTIELAHVFGLEVVAEGVEDEAAFLLLAELGCDLVQGYYVAHPMRAEDFEGWISARELHNGRLVS